jgi:DNA-directed RNA polymerase specialized sigma24 family protein
VVSGHRRSRLRQQRLSERAQSALRQARTVHEHVAVRDDLRRATDAIALLGRRDRTLVGLRAAAQLSYAEIA